MNKKLLAAAVVAAVAASPAAFADSTVYGKLHTSLDYTDFDQKGDEDLDRITGGSWKVQSRASRLGFKGSEDLGNGLKAIYQIEFGIDSTGGEQQNTSTGFTTQRNTFVGLSGDWGTALVGRHDTPMKMAFYASGNEVLGDSIIDLNAGTSLIGVFQEVRASNAIAYVSPNFSGFTVVGAIVPGEEIETPLTGPADPYQPKGKEARDGLADHYSLGAMYSGNGLKVSGGYENLDNQAGGVSARAANNDMKTWQLGGTYTWNNLQVGGEYQNTTDYDFVDNQDYYAWALTGKYTMGNNAIMAVYTNSETSPDVDPKTKTWGWGLAGEHNLSKRSKVYAAYAYNKDDRPSGEKDLANSQFSLGLIHNF
ncbi:MAG: porin [Sedimenticolaceae bacterium]